MNKNNKKFKKNKNAINPQVLVLILGITLTISIVVLNVFLNFVPNTLKTETLPDIKTDAVATSQIFQTTSESYNKSNSVNINTANINELSTLKMIGTTRATAIINYRKRHGSFNTIEEIKNVYGIGDTIFEMNKDRMTVN